MMTCQQRAGPVVVVPLAGEIDLFNCDQVYDRLYAAFVSGATVVIADFTATRDLWARRVPIRPPRRVAVPGPAERGSSVPQSVTGRPDGTLGERSPPPVPVRKTQIFGPFRTERGRRVPWCDRSTPG